MSKKVGRKPYDSTPGEVVIIRGMRNPAFTVTASARQ